MAESEIEKSNLFNCYFHLVFPAASTMPDISDMQEAPPNSLSCITITLLEVYQTLVSLDPNKAFGFDNISPKVLQICASALCEPLHHLFMMSLKIYCYPRSMEDSQVCSCIQSR